MKKTISQGGKSGKLYIIAILLILYLPIFVLVAYSFNSGESGVWKGFTLDWYTKLFNNSRMMGSLVISLKLAVYSCITSAVIGTLGAIGMTRSHFAAKGFFENLTTFPIMIPEIILALAYLSFFSSIKIPSGIFAMTLAHTTFCIPYVYINVKSRLNGLDPSIPEAALDLGASKLRMTLDILVPLIAPAIFSGTLLAFAMSFDDVIISIFLSSSTTTTLPMRIYTLLKAGVTPEINALCVIMLLVVFSSYGLYHLIKNINSNKTSTNI